VLIVGIDGDLFVAQAFTFLLAGYDTSATDLSFALYELALHPEIQQSLRAEILQVLSEHDGQLTYEGIQDMSYLDRVVSGERLNQNKQQFKTTIMQVMSIALLSWA
jgi:cytochrome P450 family 6